MPILTVVISNEDFESGLSGNWLVGSNIFSNNDRTGFQYNYFPFPAPISSVSNSFSSLEDDQGNMVFNVFSDYENHASGQYIEAYTYQERILAAEDIGLLYQFQFDHKLTPVAPFTPNINDANLIELSAFIKVLDPNNGYAEVYFDTRDTSEPTSSMETSSLFVGINPDWEGYVIQWGFLSYARNYANTGVWYDHVSFLPAGL